METFETYTEVSPSGRGVHLILRGALPPGARKRGPVECYEQGRYFTVTARSLNGTPVGAVEDRQDVLAAWHAETLPPQAQRARTTSATDPAPREAEPDDERLLARARKAKNGKKFRALFHDGDTAGYGSHSEADLALCTLLAFWTRRDEGRIDRLFRRSKLFRPKWDQSAGQGETYGQRTVGTAVKVSAPDRPPIVFTGLEGDGGARVFAGPEDGVGAAARLDLGKYGFRTGKAAEPAPAASPAVPPAGALDAPCPGGRCVPEASPLAVPAAPEAPTLGDGGRP